MKQIKHLCIIVILIITAVMSSYGQSILNRSISLQVSRQRLDNVLEIISNKGNFYFSYNSNIIKKDSLVSFNHNNKTIKEILTALFNNSYEFKESGNYIIIRKVPIRLTMVTKKAVTEDKIYAVSGFVYDEQSGNGINEASIYEKKLLASALTNNEGYFKIKLKSSKAKFAELTVSKEFYQDTTVTIEPRHNQELSITLVPIENSATNITVTPEDYLVTDSLKLADTLPNPAETVKRDTIKVEGTSLSKWFVSAKQKAQSINLNKFFTTRPYQVSFTPKLSTHGKMSAQVINNASLNVLGGYTGGTNGVELGGLFNIDKKDVKYVQAAGLFNAVGGSAKGVQIAGLNNTVLDTVQGLQAAGLSNIVKGKFSGFQLGGIYNHVTDSLQGLQIGGIGNFARKKVTGVQIAGIANISNKETDGVQIAGIVNYSKKIKGVQIGLINIADTSEGYSIGLINIILKGYHKLTFSTSEFQHVNIAFKTGNAKLYSILQAGTNLTDTAKLYSFGYGLGSELALNKKKTLCINPELSSQYLYRGSWDYTNILARAQVNFTFKINKYISIFAGPAYNILISDQHVPIDGYMFPVPPANYQTEHIDKNITGWLGWNTGINFF